MIRNRPTIAIIPVRGGSKGIPKKNIYKIENETLLERTINFAKKINVIDKIIVSTDDIEMYEISKRHKVNASSLRPEHLATDSSKTIETIKYLLKEEKIENANILLLQVTSPLRNHDDIKAIFEIYNNDYSLNAIVSCVKIIEPHPYKCVIINKNKYIEPLIGNSLSTPRQELPEVFAFNGAFYLIDSEVLINQNTLIPTRTKLYEMPLNRSINIDSEMDLLLLEIILKKNNEKNSIKN